MCPTTDHQRCLWPPIFSNEAILVFAGWTLLNLVPAQEQKSSWAHTNPRESPPTAGWQTCQVYSASGSKINNASCQQLPQLWYKRRKQVCFRGSGPQYVSNSSPLGQRGKFKTPPELPAFGWMRGPKGLDMLLIYEAAKPHRNILY